MKWSLYRRLKTIKNLKPTAVKVVMVAYCTRGGFLEEVLTIVRDFTSETLYFGKVAA